MRHFLTSISIEGFRGINNEGNPLVLKFQPEKVNSVFAPNGSGKSSIYDAVCYAITGGVPRLDGLHDSENGNDYFCNRFHSSQRATILLSLRAESGGTDIEILVERDANGGKNVSSPTGHPAPEQLLRELARSVVMLDQRHFQSFVDDSPLSRGRSFSALVGLEPLSRMRRALETLANTRTLNSDFQLPALRQIAVDNRRKVSKSRNELESSFLRLTGQPLNPAAGIEQASQEACIFLRRFPAISTIVPPVRLEETDFAALREAIRNAERSDLQERFVSLGTELARLQSVSASVAEPDASAITQAIDAYAASLAKTRGKSFGELHASLSRLLSEPEWLESTECPACLEVPESPIRETVARIADQYREVEEQAEKLAMVWRASALRSNTQTLEESGASSIAPALRRVQPLDRQVETRVVATSDVESLVEYAKELLLRVATRIKELEEQRASILAQLPPSLVDITTAVESASILSSKISTLVDAEVELSRSQDRLASRERWERFVTRAKSIFAVAEVELSTARVMELESTYRPLYLEIIGHNQVLPQLVKSPTGEELYLRLEGFFGETNLHVAALLSESYRNALAVSIFLAAALDSSGSIGLILLDDVTSSFDAGHQYKLMEVLLGKVSRASNPVGPQIIILSHDGLLQKYFDAVSSDGRPWLHQRLKGAPPRGPVIVEGFSGNRIRQAAETPLLAGELDVGAQYLRQYLEHVLLEIIQKVKVPVPIDFAIRSDRKLVSNCLDAIKSSVDLHARAGDLILEPAQLASLTGTLVPALVGNWCSHFETGALASFSQPMLLGVLANIDQIRACFQYQCSCGGTVKARYYRELTAKQCGC
ncbi:MAG TPA: AAA family ATPase [Gemmatimonas sp.]|uniref:AAA family ATPase n=1 Tax=Gemmatimonas sp. TaxID=1962908 RepID=UPI002ED9628A